VAGAGAGAEELIATVGTEYIVCKRAHAHLPRIWNA